jgi:hypothetical protein
LYIPLGGGSKGTKMKQVLQCYHFVVSGFGWLTGLTLLEGFINALYFLPFYCWIKSFLILKWKKVRNLLPQRRSFISLLLSCWHAWLGYSSEQNQLQKPSFISKDFLLTEVSVHNLSNEDTGIECYWWSYFYCGGMEQ